MHQKKSFSYRTNLTFPLNHFNYTTNPNEITIYYICMQMYSHGQLMLLALSTWYTHVEHLQLYSKLDLLDFSSRQVQTLQGKLSLFTDRQRDIHIYNKRTARKNQTCTVINYFVLEKMIQQANSFINGIFTCFIILCCRYKAIIST